MFAVINLPGSYHFSSFGPASKSDCEKWLDEEIKDMLRTELLSSTLPRQIISNREAKKWKYRDGSKVFINI